MTWTIPELAPRSPNFHTHQREDVSALDRFNMHRCPTRPVFSGTGLELVTRRATIRYLYHSVTAAMGEGERNSVRVLAEFQKLPFSNRWRCLQLG
ncbi:uncharacterized protein TNCV_2678061 [Trichonephila clavipes]|nr:uncharacterized protein TNCV_2678061 [Trichonephila clavipes]